jgi:hypothetical protein
VQIAASTTILETEKSKTWRMRGLCMLYEMKGEEWRLLRKKWMIISGSLRTHVQERRDTS